MIVTVTIPGEPQAWQRAANRASGGRYTDPKYAEWLERARSRMQATMLVAGASTTYDPVAVSIEAVWSLPAKAHRVRSPVTERRVRAVAPDADNVAKAVLDAAGNRKRPIVMRDDAQVWRLEIECWYGTQDEEPYVRVTFVTTAEDGLMPNVAKQYIVFADGEHCILPLAIEADDEEEAAIECARMLGGCATVHSIERPSRLPDGSTFVTRFDPPKIVNSI